MNIERILNQFKKHYDREVGTRSNPKEARKLLKKYQSIPLTLPITDEPMRRICEVLTRAKYTTFESCEGHGKTLPRIYLECASQYHLRHLTSILRREAHETTFCWDLKTGSAEVFVNSEHPLYYTMQPDLAFSNASPENKEDYQSMIDDLDIIGISILRYFSFVDINSLEQDRKKIDKLAGKFQNPNLPEDFFRI